MESEILEATEPEVLKPAELEAATADTAPIVEPEVVVPPPKIRPRLMSSHDFSNRSVIAGWAFDPSNPDEPITVEIMVNRVVIGRAIADIYRADLESAGIGNGCHSFEFRLQPGQLPHDVRHTIWVRNQATGIPLLNSPKILPVEPAPPPEAPVEPAVSTEEARVTRDAELGASVESSPAVDAVAEPVAPASEPTVEGAIVAISLETATDAPMSSPDTRETDTPEPVSIADASAVDEADRDRRELAATQSGPAETVVGTDFDEPLPAPVEPAAVSAATSPVVSPPVERTTRAARLSLPPKAIPFAVPLGPILRLGAFFRRAARRRTRKADSSLPPPS